MLYHCRAVARGAKQALIVVDMPFATVSADDVGMSIKNCARAMAEGGAHAVKVEGGSGMARLVAALVATGMPVMGHIGLTPQSIHQFGGYSMQGKDDATRRRLLADALELEAAGAFSIVLELVDHELAAQITQRVKIPTIGIGAGAACDGQVQVFHDVFGLFEDFVPKHTRRYTHIADALRAAAKKYAEDVAARKFPS
jgi:3-methyl-2-oxobutanoate hydroxymethyltransferase